MFFVDFVNMMPDVAQIYIKNLADDTKPYSEVISVEQNAEAH